MVMNMYFHETYIVYFRIDIFDAANRIRIRASMIRVKTLTAIEDVKELKPESLEAVEDVEEIEAEKLTMKHSNNQIQKSSNPSFLYFQTERKQIIIYFVLWTLIGLRRSH